MDFRELFLGRGEFKSAADIVRIIQESPNFEPGREDVQRAEPLLIFQTSKQQTWLVATNERLYCVLDDLSKSFTRVQWSLPKEKLVVQGEVTVNIGTRDHTQRTGLLDIGERRSWLYSKKLFTRQSIEALVRNLIRNQMLS